MTPALTLQHLSRKRRAAPGFLDPRGGRAGRSPALGALSSDGPAHLGGWLARQGQAFEVFDTEAGRACPADLARCGALAIPGGEMSANDAMPSLRRAETLFRRALAAGLPTLGHCLGGRIQGRWPARMFRQGRCLAGPGRGEMGRASWIRFGFRARPLDTLGTPVPRACPHAARRQGHAALDASHRTARHPGTGRCGRRPGEISGLGLARHRGRRA